MIQKSDIEKLERFIKGLSDGAENQYIYSLFSENGDTKGFRQYFSKTFDEYLKNNPDEHYNLAYLLDRIHHTIHKNENKRKRTIAGRLYKWYSLAAAVLLIPILIATVFTITGQEWSKTFVAEDPVTSTLFAPLGARISFSLPDGTKGWLNSGSSIKYSLPFSQNRQVAVSGEAWLDVAADKNHPFEISVGNSKVKVIGTKFNVNAYPGENHIEVILEEGKVEFSVPGLKSDIEMKPNERLVFREGIVSIDIADVAKYSAWTKGKLMFRSDPMTEVAKRIERWYNAEVELVDKDLEKDLITGTFQDDLLEDVLHYLSMTSPIRYEIIDQQVNPEGIVQKTKVLLYRKKIKQ